MLIVVEFKKEVIFHIYYVTCFVSITWERKIHDIFMKSKKRTIPYFLFLCSCKSSFYNYWTKLRFIILILINVEITFLYFSFMKIILLQLHSVLSEEKTWKIRRELIFIFMLSFCLFWLRNVALLLLCIFANVNTQIILLMFYVNVF